MSSVLTFPVRGSPRVDALLVGGGLHLLAVWVPLLPFVAVAARTRERYPATAETESHVDPERPGWRPVGALLRDGLRVAVTTVGYLAVPVVLLVVTLGGPLEGFDPTGTTDGLLFTVGSTVSTLLAAAICYPLPAALAAVAREGKLRAAVNTTLVGAAAQDAGYLVATLLAAGGLGLTAAAYGPLNRVALGFFCLFYVEVVAAAAVGKATGRAWRRRGV
ncbi:DUF4013 domain-containing protein [Halorubrum sp. SD626R]|uniref:DUF4013 domain-containing protein n=1 Tax=Halorubrum sp. SD626R TaxID=1419722 RepID=UPI0010F46374|nr:DUF4013 domain-containing protein [Halorubrum sp. SD626R]TKX78185.1 DUF4013 domain-containing protein [Halorubrum sp. SD626R]